jgi:amino acid adenylation domain-containing protein
MSESTSTDSPSLFVLDGLTQNVDALAVIDGGTSYRYRDMLLGAFLLSKTLDTLADGEKVGIFGRPSFAAYCAIIACFLTGHPWVPLNPKFPATRTREIIQRASLQTVFVQGVLDAQGLADELNIRGGDFVSLEDVLFQPQGTTPHSEDQKSPEQVITHFRDRVGASFAEVAYLMFTSGSTGQPKGVEVSRANLLAFLQATRTLFTFSPSDRFSGYFDLTFDLSVFDVFVPLSIGASVHPLDDGSRIVPQRFMQAHELSVWFSVPSLVGILADKGLLRPEANSLLRHSLFCGEPLTSSSAKNWASFAPTSRIYNLYGPTELTIACSLYEVDTLALFQGGTSKTIDIGTPFPLMDAELLNEQGEFLPGLSEGELVITGPQTALGYFLDQEKTQRSFGPIEGLPGSSWYRTGDIVKRSMGGGFSYLGRRDNQVQRRGFRIELGEVEAALRSVSGNEVVVAALIPDASGGDLVAFLSTTSPEACQRILREMSHRLPPYMVPSRIISVDDFPKNANGKIDRLALTLLTQT